MQLYEKYRPVRFEDVLGQGKAVKAIEKVLKTGWGGRAWFISGASGTGKSSLARIIARIGADDWFIQQYDSADALTTTELDSLERTMQLYGGGKGGRCFIIEEAHGLRRAAMRRLLGILERIPKHCVFIFTTTRENQLVMFEDKTDAAPLTSRCIEIALTTQGLAKIFAAHVKRIAGLENLDGKPDQAYYRLAQDCKNNCRAMLQAVETGTMTLGDKL